MKVVYTLASNIYQPSDIERALLCAETAAHQMGKAVRIVLESKAQMPVLNSVNGLTVKGNTFSFNNIQGVIETRLQYKGAKGEIILTVCPTLQLLQKLQDSGVSLLIVVPEMTASTDVYHWLDLYSAMDIQSSKILQGIASPVSGVMRAVGYLKNYSLRMNILLTSVPVYTGEIADVANTLKKQGIVPDYEEVLKYCLFRGLSFDEACVVAKAFSQRSLLKMRGNPNFGLYWNNINDSKWEQNP